jgi:protein ImuA
MPIPRNESLVISPCRPLLTELRQSLSDAERTTGLVEERSASVSFGIGAIDAALGGGLACSTVHELAAARETEIAAATAFALAVTTLSMRQSCRLGSTGRVALWITEELSLCENGVPYGPGLEETGIPPERLITVAAPRLRDALWVTEEALRCRAVGAVISELSARAVEPTVTRRLSLAAAAGHTLGLFLRPQPDNEPGAFATRWIVGAAASLHSSPSQRYGGIGPPRLAIRLVRNRRGHLGAWIVEWNSVEQRFELATNSEPVAGAIIDRPNRAAVA